MPQRVVLNQADSVQLFFEYVAPPPPHNDMWGSLKAELGAPNRLRFILDLLTPAEHCKVSKKNECWEL